MSTDYDVVVIGGGMAGASLACALSEQQLKIAVLEANNPEVAASGYDDRGIALSLSSRQIYESLNIWSMLAEHVTPIDHIHISEKGRFPKVRFSAKQQGLDALGYVVIAKELGNILLTKVKQLGDVNFISQATSTAIARFTDHIAVSYLHDGEERDVTAKLLVVADGANSATSTKLGICTQVTDYGQHAFVTNVIPEKAHNNTAFERFTPEGSIALLPSTGQRCVLIHVVSDKVAHELEQFSAEAFLKKAQQRFGKRLGNLENPGTIRSYPLALMVPDTQIQERVVLLGNAAHAVHPNAAQGFNLCLRDIAELADTVINEFRQGRDIGNFNVLQHYYHKREQDQQRVIRFTQQLNTLFYSHNPLKQFARHSVMLAIDALPLLKEYVIKQSTGLTGVQPAVISKSLLN